MKMVIGGAYQGKKEYARRLYPEVRWSDGESCGLDEIFSCQGMVYFEEFIKRWIQEKGAEYAQELSEQILKRNPNLVVVTAEIGYGLVPVDAFERQYRECVGRICTDLAACAERVDRVQCGIGNRIK